MIRHFILALYLVIAAMLLQLIAPMPAHAINWNSDPVAPITITITDAATADFWQACSTLAGPAPDDDEPGWIAYFDWYSIENPDNLNLVPFCVVAYVGPETPEGTAQPILALYIRFYRGQTGHIDASYILAMIHAQKGE